LGQHQLVHLQPQHCIQTLWRLFLRPWKGEKLQNQYVWNLGWDPGIVERSVCHSVGSANNNKIKRNLIDRDATTWKYKENFVKFLQGQLYSTMICGWTTRGR
jgi:hypothetical protein